MTLPVSDQIIRVVVVDDQELMRDGLTSLLSIQPQIEIIGAAANGEEAIALVLEVEPDIVLMDVRMPIMDGVAATTKICAQMPDCQVLMLTTFDDEEYIVKALLGGASGYLLKDIPVEDLANAIRLTYRGIYQLDPSIAGKLVGVLGRDRRQNQVHSNHSSPPLDLQPTPHNPSTQVALSERELEVLRLVATGATNREIAQQLVITEGTVKNHVSNILSRLNLRDRTQAAIYAHELNLI